MKKQELLDKLSAKLDELPDLENLKLDYLCLNFTDYNPDNSKYDTNYSYRQFEITLNKTELIISDTSEPFKCSMGARSCTERGYCNGDC